MIRTSSVLVRIAGALLCAVSAAATAGAAPAERDYVFYHENVLGTSLELQVRASSDEAAQAAESRALREIDRLAAILSSYDPASEFRRWQATLGAPATVSADLSALLAASDAWRARSHGAFDPRVQALTDLWSSCARLGRLPTDDELAAARALMAAPAWRLDPTSGTAEHLTPCPLTLNSIGKGYVIGRAGDAALDRARGVTGVLLNIGGDVRAVGDVARTIGVAPAVGDSETTPPVARVEVRNRSVATSGNAQRGLRIGSQWYSHIFDPRTGLPAREVVSATVIADLAADANALATTLNVLPVDEGLRLAQSMPEMECLVVTADGRVYKSAGWAQYEQAAAPIAPAPLLAAPPANDGAPKPDPGAKPGAGAKAAAGESWGDRHELAVNFEINGADAGGRYRRPYVAVWVEDKDGLTVRTLALWLQAQGSGPRWHPELKRWYRDDQMRRLVDETSLIDTVSRPTRPPGKYAVTWDGKDDHGKPIAAGKYSLCIEAAREHGTYQVIRKDITVGGDKPFGEELKGNVEIKSASVEYRKKSGK